MYVKNGLHDFISVPEMSSCMLNRSVLMILHSLVLPVLFADVLLKAR